MENKKPPEEKTKIETHMNNRKTAGAIQLTLTFTVIILSAVFICSLTVDALNYIWLHWTSGLLSLISVIYFIFGGFYYLEIEISEDSLEIKYYNTFPFSRSFKMFRIPIHSFVKYEISGNKYFKRKLFLFQITAGQLAKYPPVYITALSEKNEKDLSNFFLNLKDKI